MPELDKILAFQKTAKIDLSRFTFAVHSAIPRIGGYAANFHMTLGDFTGEIGLKSVSYMLRISEQAFECFALAGKAGR